MWLRRKPLEKNYLVGGGGGGPPGSAHIAKTDTSISGVCGGGGAQQAPMRQCPHHHMVVERFSRSADAAACLSKPRPLHCFTRTMTPKTGRPAASPPLRSRWCREAEPSLTGVPDGSECHPGPPGGATDIAAGEAKAESWAELVGTSARGESAAVQQAEALEPPCRPTRSSLGPSVYRSDESRVTLQIRGRGHIN